MLYNAGWTPRIDPVQLAEQRVNTCRDLCELYNTDYWRERLENAEAELERLTDPLATAEDWAAQPMDAREKRAHEWQKFLARMNALAMVERRGTVLTPYGWRLPE